MEKKDLRIRRTYKLLSDALTQLLTEKPFEKISVTDICERAMVHRATFYAHFEDKYQLLNYCILSHSAVFDEVPITEHTLEGYKEYFMNVARILLSQIEKKSDTYMALMRQNNSTFEHMFVENIYDKICSKYDSCVEQGISMPVPKEVLASFFAGACSNIILWWIKNEMPISSKELVSYMDKLIAFG